MPMRISADGNPCSAWSVACGCMMVNFGKSRESTKPAGSLCAFAAKLCF
jgi:hypothetical protein